MEEKREVKVRFESKRKKEAQWNERLIKRKRPWEMWESVVGFRKSNEGGIEKFKKIRSRRLRVRASRGPRDCWRG